MSPAPTAPCVERDDRLQLADGATLAYSVVRARVPASRAAIVLLHGLASNRTRWAEFVETTSLTTHYEVMRVDLRGHGESIFSGKLTLERWCDDLAELLTARNDPRAILIGHSLGAQVALAFAARHPERCAALALIDPVFRTALRGKWRVVAALGPAFSLAALCVRGANSIGLRRRGVLPYDLRALDTLARQALGSRLAEAAFIRRYSSTRADLRHFRTANYLQNLVEMFRPIPSLASIRIPVLALLSTGANFADAGQTTHELAALAQLQTVQVECNHWPLTEKPVEVRVAIEDWCEALQ